MSLSESQVITKVIKDKDYSVLTNNFLDETYFFEHRDAFNYVREYYEKYKSTPTAEQLIANCPNFSFTDLPSNFKSVLDDIREFRLFNRCVTLIQSSGKMMEKDANDGVRYLLSHVDELKLTNEITCVDMMHDKERLEVWEERKKHPAEIYIETPFKELNEYVYGYQRGGDLFLYLSKSNTGKSQVLCSSAAKACMGGDRVLFISPEMPKLDIQYRIDTYITNFSNLAMQKGLQINGYKEYIEDMNKSDKHLFVVDMTDLNRKITVSKIEQLIQQTKCDIVFIDGIKYVRQDYPKKGQTEAEIEGEVGAELLSMSTQYKIPVVGVVQARRRQNESKSNEQVDMDAESIGGSYSLAQVSTRIIAIQKKAGALQLSIAKNRYGLVDKKLLYAYDFDHLTFNYIPDLEDIEKDEDLKTQQQEVKKTVANIF